MRGGGLIEDLRYLDFRGGRERESRTHCGKQKANLGFPSASQTFNEKSFSGRHEKSFPRKKAKNISEIRVK